MTVVLVVAGLAAAGCKSADGDGEMLADSAGVGDAMGAVDTRSESEGDAIPLWRDPVVARDVAGSDSGAVTVDPWYDESAYLTASYYTTVSGGTEPELVCDGPVYVGDDRQLMNCTCRYAEEYATGAFEDHANGSTDYECRVEYEGYRDDLEAGVDVRMILRSPWFLGEGSYYTAYRRDCGTFDEATYNDTAVPPGARFVRDDDMLSASAHDPANGECTLFDSSESAGRFGCEHALFGFSEDRCLITVTSSKASSFTATFWCEQETSYDEPDPANGLARARRVSRTEGTFGFSPAK